MSKTSAEKLMEDGKILEHYGNKNFITISPALGIDKVKFSIIENGTGGKNPADIYITMSAAIAFFEDVKDGTAGRRFNADIEKAEPEAYIFRTADTLDGHGKKEIRIGGGKYGVRFQTIFSECRSGNGKRICTCYMHELRFAADLYLAYIGLIPCSRYILHLIQLLDVKEMETEEAIRKKRDAITDKEAEIEQEKREIGHLTICG